MEHPQQQLHLLSCSMLSLRDAGIRESDRAGYFFCYSPPFRKTTKGNYNSLGTDSPGTNDSD